MRTTECVTTNTPWGKADMVTRYVKGVNFYNTPGHGGFKLSESVNRLIPVRMRCNSFAGLGLKGWYEEDCDWAIVVAVLSGIEGFELAFDTKEIAQAHESLQHYMPSEYSDWASNQKLRQ
jgi:hypothetical protein